MLIDAGHLQNAGGGFIAKGLSMNAGAVRFTLGEYKAVNVTGSDLRDSIVPFPAPGPSPVLLQLLGLMIEAGKEISAVKDVLTGDQQQHNVPATTTLALIEQGLKTFTAIYNRVHLALKAELAKLYQASIYRSSIDRRIRFGPGRPSFFQAQSRSTGTRSPRRSPRVSSGSLP
jgi:chaperonin GroES